MDVVDDDAPFACVLFVVSVGEASESSSFFSSSPPPPPPDPPPSPPPPPFPLSPGSPRVRSLRGWRWRWAARWPRVARTRTRPTARPLEAARETEATPPPTFAQPPTETRTALRGTNPPTSARLTFPSPSPRRRRTHFLWGARRVTRPILGARPPPSPPLSRPRVTRPRRSILPFRRARCVSSRRAPRCVRPDPRGSNRRVSTRARDPRGSSRHTSRAPSNANDPRGAARTPPAPPPRTTRVDGPARETSTRASSRGSATLRFFVFRGVRFGERTSPRARRSPRGLKVCRVRGRPTRVFRGFASRGDPTRIAPRRTDETPRRRFQHRPREDAPPTVEIRDRRSWTRIEGGLSPRTPPRENARRAREKPPRLHRRHRRHRRGRSRGSATRSRATGTRRRGARRARRRRTRRASGTGGRWPVRRQPRGARRAHRRRTRRARCPRGRGGCRRAIAPPRRDPRVGRRRRGRRSRGDARGGSRWGRTSAWAGRGIARDRGGGWRCRCRRRGRRRRSGRTRPRGWRVPSSWTMPPSTRVPNGRADARSRGFPSGPPSKRSTPRTLGGVVDAREPRNRAASSAAPRGPRRRFKSGQVDVDWENFGGLTGTTL